MGKRLLGIAVVVMLALVLSVWVAMQLGPKEAPQPDEPVGAALAQMPATVSLLSSEYITTTGESSSVGSIWYSEGIGYVDTTVASGAITYTWQSSPDGTNWYTHYRVPSITATGKVTVTLTTFGKHLRLAYETYSGQITTTATLVMKP